MQGKAAPAAILDLELTRFRCNQILKSRDYRHTCFFHFLLPANDFKEADLIEPSLAV